MFSERTNWKLEPNRFTQVLEQVRASGRKIIDLTASNPTRVGLKYDSGAILRSLGSERALDYDPQSKGLLAAREAVAGYYREDHDAEVDLERLILTTSTSEGYSFVFRLLCNAGDELLVPKPSYPLFDFLADLQDVKLVPYPLIYDHGWQIDFHSLQKSVTSRTRGIVLVHPNNPTGSYVKCGERELLNSFCRERGLALIVDEVFLDYGLEVGRGGVGHPVGSDARPQGNVEKRPASFATNAEVLTFTLSGLSKISALPQMKAAWIVMSGPSSQAAEAIGRLEVIADTYLSMNAPMQWAIPVLLGQRKSVQNQLIARVRTNLMELDRQLAGQKACQRLEVEGGWYSVLRVPVTRSDEELAITLLERDAVQLHPGHFYDFPSDGYLVLSLITPEKEFAEGVSRVLAFLQNEA